MSNGYKTYSLVGIPHDFMKCNNAKVLVLNTVNDTENKKNMRIRLQTASFKVSYENLNLKNYDKWIY